MPRHYLMLRASILAADAGALYWLLFFAMLASMLRITITCLRCWLYIFDAFDFAIAAAVAIRCYATLRQLFSMLSYAARCRATLQRLPLYKARGAIALRAQAISTQHRREHVNTSRYY